MQGPTFKVLLVGATCTGKSSIIQEYHEGVNDNGHRVLRLMTSKMEPYIIEVYDSVTINEPASMSKELFENVRAVVFVAAYDSADSLKELTDGWMQRLNQFLSPEDYLKFFIVNKCDIKGTNKSKIHHEQIEQARVQLGVDVAHDASVEQKIGLRPLFREIGDKLLQRFPPN